MSDLSRNNREHFMQSKSTWALPATDLGECAYRFSNRKASDDNKRVSTVSSLEAFNCYPTDGNFTAMACRPTVFIGHLSQWFLSY